jgi:ABC-type transport system substrate-binding protein
MAVDVKQIQDTVYDGDGWNQTTLQLPGFDWVLPDAEFTSRWFKRDVAAARQLLTQAGITQPIELELVNLQLLPAYLANAELTIAQLKDIGVNGKIRLVDIPGWNTQQAGQGDYQGYHGPVQTQISANADLRLRYFTRGNRNASKVSDPRLDDMINRQAVMARDPAGRKNALMEIQRYLMDQGYLIPVWGSAQPTGRWPWVKNWRPLGQPQSEPEPFNYVWIDK